MKKKSTKTTEGKKPVAAQNPEKAADALFDRVAAILDEARSSVVRAVNSRMVLANWLIGREIVQTLQGGEERAAYGKAVILNNVDSRLKPLGQFSSLRIRHFGWPIKNQTFLAHSSTRANN